MSSADAPRADGAPTGAAAPVRPAAAARRLDQVSALVLLGGLFAAAFSVAPSLLDPSVLLPPRRPSAPALSALPGVARSSAARPNATTWASDRPPRFAPEDDPPRLTELERLYPDGMSPGAHAREPSAKAARPRSARVLAAAQVRALPLESAPVSGVLAAGDAVTVIREAGEFVLVVRHGDDDGGATGWVRRRDLAGR